MRNFKHYVTFILIFGVAVAAPMVAFAQSVTLADASDVFYISSPTPNSWVKGTVQVRWRVYDDEQTSVGYEMTLESTSNCAARLGTIASGSAGSNAGSDVVTNWNTGGPLLDIASVSDGNYCLRTCVSLRNGATPYSACAQRVVTVRNHNLVPQFTTFPSNTTIQQSDYWQFDVNSNDGNGDSVIYRLVTAPNFLRISQQSGLIYTSGNKTPGSYNVTVSIDDGYGGVTTRSFTLTVAAPAPSSSATSSVTSSMATSSVSSASTSSSATSSANQVAIIKFIKPDAQSVFSNKDNLVSWEATDADGIKSIVLQYTDSDGNLKDLATLGADVSEYNWDVGQLTAGDYTLQLKVEDKLGEVTALVSPKFAIDNNPGTEPGLQSEPLITKFKPGEGEQVTAVRPEIIAEFTPPQAKKIDTSTFKFFLDNEDQIGWCEVTEQGFKCTPKSDLALGLHKVNAEVKSDDGKTAKAEWTFSVVKQTANSGGFPTEFDFNGQKIPLSSLVWVVVICLLALVLLLIPWFLYLLWRRREERKAEVVQAEPTTPPDYYTPAVSYSAPGDAALPNVTTNYYYTPEAFDGANLEIQPVVDEQPVVRDTNYAAAEPVVVEPAPVNVDFQTVQPASTAELEAADAAVAPAPEPTPNPDSSPAFVEPPAFTGNDPLAPATSLPQAVESAPSNSPAAPDWLNPVGAGSNPLPPASNTTGADDLGSFGYGRKADDGNS